ncbi:hypothetical protein LIER_12510 [Lithospermum erythrorhizon]|uniref:Uncharacterized protein n=1 Tax=Lithospermum erythrorhizon TaxID=34254 RepID=A0AAV3PW56_LITER
MAGLQYNFFPTDFFFPRQQTISRDTNGVQQVPLIKSRNSEDVDDMSTQIRTNSGTKTLKAVSNPASLALLRIKKQNQESNQ